MTAFDDLEDAEANKPENDDNESETESMTETTNQTDTSTDTTPERTAEQPAFQYDDAVQKAVYPRPETWEAFEDFLDFDVRAQLRREHDVSDIEKRELHDAVLAAVQENPEAVVEAFLDALIPTK